MRKENNLMDKSYKVNDQITAHQVILIDEKGNMRGKVPLQLALDSAEVAGTDLVQVSDGEDAPICKILDYGKMMYNISKKQKSNKSKNNSHTKEIRCKINTSDHDLEIKHRKIQEFLEKKYIVKYIIELTGREKYMSQEAVEKMKQRLLKFKEKATWSEPSISGGGSKMFISTTIQSS